MDNTGYIYGGWYGGAPINGGTLWETFTICELENQHFNSGKPTISMISMTIFNIYVKLPKGKPAF